MVTRVVLDDYNVAIEQQVNKEEIAKGVETKNIASNIEWYRFNLNVKDKMKTYIGGMFTNTTTLDLENLKMYLKLYDKKGKIIHKEYSIKPIVAKDEEILLLFDITGISFDTYRVELAYGIYVSDTGIHKPTDYVPVLKEEKEDVKEEYKEEN